MNKNNIDSTLKDFYTASVILSVFGVGVIFIGTETKLPTIEYLGLGLLGFVILINVALLSKDWIHKAFTSRRKNSSPSVKEAGQK